MKWICWWNGKVWKADNGYIITKNYSDTLGGFLPRCIEFWVFASHGDWEKGINVCSFSSIIKKHNGVYTLQSMPKLKDVKKWVAENA